MQVRLVRYWDFDYPDDRPGRIGRPDAEHVEEFRRALDEAVRLRLRADVPVGCYLSGGLDSCAVLGLAATHRSDPIRAFTLSFDRPDYDETAIAREMAELANAEFHPIPITQSDLADHFADAVAHAETLAINAPRGGQVPAQPRRAGCRLQGGAHRERGPTRSSPATPISAATSGSMTTRPPAAMRGPSRRSSRSSEVRNPVSRGLLLPDGEGASLEGLRAVLGFAPSWLETGATQAHKLRALFAPDFAAEFAGRDAYRELLEGLDVPGQLAGRAAVNQSLYLWAKVMLPNYVLAFLGDRMEMAHSIEGRLPFLDHPVVELARDLPLDQKIRGTVEKYVLREAARPVLTATVSRPAKAPVHDAPGRPEHRRPALPAHPGYAARTDPGRRCRSSTDRGSWRCSISSRPWTTASGPPTTCR